MRVVEEDGSIIYVGYIYRHWIINDEGNNMSYIGITTRKPYDRWGKNGIGYAPRDGKNETIFWRAICKYGWDNFNHDIIGIVEANDDEQLVLDLKEFERYYVDLFDSFYNGYNMTTGGDSGCIRSQETRERHRKAQTGKKYNMESRRKMSESAKQRPPVTDETRKRQSESRKGLLAGERNPMYGMTGDKNPFYGQKHSKDSRKRMSEGQRKLYENGYINPNKGKGRKVICLNTKEVFNNANEANEKYKGNIRKCCKGIQEHAGKHPETKEPLHWMYYDEYLKLKEKDDNENGKH